MITRYKDYSPQVQVTGRLRSIGSDTMDQLMGELWEKKFREYHPGLVVFHQGEGSGTAIPALINGLSEFGPMSREAKEREIQQFFNKFGYKPLQMPVAIDALAVYVHADNPIKETGLTLKQLDSMFSSSRKRGGSHIRIWGQVGLTGSFGNETVLVYSRNKLPGTYGVFKKLVLDKGDYKASNREMNGSREVVSGIEKNKGGIGYSGIAYKTPGVAIVPIAKEQGGKAYMPTPENAFNGNYPIARNLYLTINHKPGTKLTPLQEEFMRFVFSKQGQQAVVADGFFPVSADVAREQLKTLGINPGF